MLRAIFLFHREVNGWHDIGYNFVIDRFGRVFEARAGGIDEPVAGAQAGGYNFVSTGVAVLGSLLGHAASPRRARRSLQRLLAWKLSLHGTPPTGRVIVRVSSGGRALQQIPGPCPRLAAADRRPPRRRRDRLPGRCALRAAARDPQARAADDRGRRAGDARAGARRASRARAARPTAAGAGPAAAAARHAQPARRQPRRGRAGPAPGALGRPAGRDRASTRASPKLSRTRADAACCRGPSRSAPRRPSGCAPCTPAGPPAARGLADARGGARPGAGRPRTAAERLAVAAARMMVGRDQRGCGRQAALPAHQQLDLAGGQPRPRVGLHEQRRRRAPLRPRRGSASSSASSIQASGRAAACAFDRVELPVRVRASDGAIEAQEGDSGGQPEQVGEVVVGPLFPSAGPDELEMRGQVEQVSGRSGRKEVRYALDRVEAAARRPPAGAPRTARSPRRCPPSAAAG